VGTSPRFVVLGDLNMDNVLDLVSANASSNNLSVRLGNGAGSFGSATTFSVGTSPLAVALANFNRDVQLVDQTIRTGPDAPDLANKRICANVLSFSPFVLATVAPTATIEADTFVSNDDDDDEEDTNFGRSKILSVDNSPSKRTFLRFTVTGLGGRSIGSAHVLLRVADTSSASSSSRGRIHRITSCSWNERTVTWKNKPSIDGPDLDPAGAGPAARRQIVDFNVTAAFPAGSADGAYCFAVDTASSDGVVYESRESSSAGAPKLVLELAP
jgi:hypothetical protein